MDKPIFQLKILSLTMLFAFPSAYAQHTFSIVAVDSLTREVGSAGASYIADAIVISDLHPDVGAIHTQA